MSEDTEVASKLWDSKIPVAFELSKDEIVTTQKPQPYYLLVPRMTYFPLLSEKIAKYFAAFVNLSDEDQLWLEYDECPVKWHYPVGVIHDLLKMESEISDWKITVHFKDFPKEELMQFRTKDAVKSHFVQCLKEADQLKHQSQVINDLLEKDQGILWKGLLNDRYEQFWSVNRRFMENSDAKPIRYVPFRLYRVDRPFIQRLCKPVKDNGDRTTLADLISSLFTESELPSGSYQVISHGIELPLDTPMLWLAESYSYPDNFVHLCLRPNSKSL